MARTIQAFALKTTIAVDNAKGSAALKATEKDVDNLGKRFTKLGPEINKSMAGAEKAGRGFGKNFSDGATSVITGSMSALGQTLGALIGTAMAPGIGTAIGSTIGSGIDTALQKVSGPILQTITQGIELNKLLEVSKIHFTTFVGNEKQAVAHLEELKKLSGDTGLRMGVLVEGSQRLEEFTGKLDLTRLIMRAAADQSALFYGDATKGFDDMSDSLGRIVLRGEDVGKLMKKLETQGVHWKQYLAEGLGISEKQVAALVKAGRIKGEGIATLTAQGIERHAGGFAQTIGTIGPGVEQRVGALMEMRAAEGTQRITGGIGDAYTKFAQLLASPQAKQIVDFIDKMGGYVVDFTEKAVKTGVSVESNIAEGLMNFSPATMMQSFGKLGDFVETGLKTVFEIKSPSERSAREIGEPMGEGLGVGMVRKFQGYLQGKGKDEIVATLEQLLKDPRIKAFLDLITKSEVGKDPNAAARLFGPLGHVADPSQFFAATGGWPGMRVKSPTLGRTVWTHPLGGKQIEPGTAKAFSQATGTNLPMDAHTQDLIAAWLITQTKGALEKILGGDAPGAMKGLGGTWESFKVNSPNKAAGLAAQFNAAISGRPINVSNPMPVRIVGAQGQYLDNLQSFTQQNLANFKAQSGTPGDGGPGRSAGYAAMGADAQALTVTLGEEQAAIVTVTDANKELITTTSLTADQIAGMSVKMRPLIPLISDVSDSARAAYATNADVQKLNRELYIENASLGQQLQSAIGQVAGMLPSGGQVGKKRGFFSKLLGFAAPFLSFIPGIGPILSTVAGAAGNAIGGNYGAAVSGIAGGFASGGVFRSSSSSHPPSGSSGHGRAAGGPVRAGVPYIVGEHRPELFVPDQNGRIQPNVQGGGLHPAHAAILNRVADSLDRFESMPAHQVVATGASGLMSAMGNNARLTEMMGRRLRLA